jgi:hypothetical protein
MNEDEIVPVEQKAEEVHDSESQPSSRKKRTRKAEEKEERKGKQGLPAKTISAETQRLISTNCWYLKGCATIVEATDQEVTTNVENGMKPTYVGPSTTLIRVAKEWEDVMTRNATESRRCATRVRSG